MTKIVSNPPNWVLKFVHNVGFHSMFIKQSEFH